MSNPIPGQRYIVKKGDTLSSIAARAYGNAGLWPKIKAANQTGLKSDNPDAIFPGEVLNIPLLPDIQALKTEQIKARLTGNKDDALTIMVGGQIITPLSARIFKQVDTAADGWAATLEWIPGENKVLDEILKPYKYPQASVYIGNNLVINGLVYTLTTSLNDSGYRKTIYGYSYSVDALDSTIKPPYEKNNVTLEQRASELIAPLGIKAIFEVNSGGIFKRVTAEPEDTIFEHLVKLAAQRGLLVSSTPEGNLSFIRSGSGGSAGTLKEGDQLVIDWNGFFDGRKRFNAYRAIGQSPGSNAKATVAIDPVVPRSRFTTFNANDTTNGNIKNAAEWRRSKQLADTLSMTLPVYGWLAPNGQIWRENTLVTVISEAMFCPNGFTFLTKKVEFVLDENGNRTNLELVPPQVYTGGEIIEPWS